MNREGATIEKVDQTESMARNRVPEILGHLAMPEETQESYAIMVAHTSSLPDINIGYGQLIIDEFGPGSNTVQIPIV
jgi:hypothetical protein